MENQVDTIDLHQLFGLIWRNVILIGLVTILITSAVGLYTYFGMEKKYSSNTTLRITPRITNDSYNYNDVITSQKLVKEYAIIAKSRLVLDKVIDNLDLSMEYEELADSVKVTSIQDTSVISIEVTLNDPDDAVKVADEVASVFKEEIKLQVKIDTISTIDKAVRNVNPVSPNLRLNVIIGFVLGGMLSVGFVLLREFLNNTVKDEADVARHLKLPVIGVVPNLDRKYII